MPCISVIMPLYNKELFVERAVRSALSQSFEDFELIVVNDGSTDKGPEKVMTMKDERIKIIEQPNAGVSAARNRGIREAKADLIAFLDADDEWANDFLETILHLREQLPGCDVFATSYCFCGDGYRRPAIVRKLPPDFREGLLTAYFDIAAHSDPPLWTSAVAVTKCSLLSVDCFPPCITSGEDLLTWAKLAARYDIAYCSAAKAYFWEPRAMTDRPGRIPQIPDIVGSELLNLMRESLPSRVEGMQGYLALWHRMRGVIFMRLGDRRHAWAELRTAIHQAPGIKLYLLLILTFVPSTVARRMYTILNGLRAKLRTK